MLIVGDNLYGLIQQENICGIQSYDTTSISLTLDESIIHLSPSAEIDTLVYGEAIPSSCLREEIAPSSGFILPPRSSVLGCSSEVINMPAGYFGLIQTKGSLARLFVSLHYSDGQVDPGYTGKLTFEIMNGSDFNIKLKPRQPVGNLYIFKASTDSSPLYSGRYNNATGPTFSRI